MQPTHKSKISAKREQKEIERDRKKQREIERKRKRMRELKRERGIYIYKEIEIQ